MEYTKQTIIIKLIFYCIAFALWAFSLYFLRNEQSHFSSYIFLVGFVFFAVKDYFGWRKYKKENSQING